uniref:Uncharacterized protein n=1 Tax=Hyaloperonospora arabidopsidis (strain Emoy2) TaxID=559515 RepID=M4BQ30_HYAAE
MTTDSPTSKCGRRIIFPPSDSISFTRSVLRTIAAVYCGSVTGCLRLHYTCFGSARRCFGNCDNQQTREIPALQRSRLLEKSQDDVAAGEQRAVHDVCQCGTLLD